MSSEKNMYSGSYLITYSGTIEGVKTEIDEANKKAVERGFRPSVYIIICKEYYTYFDDNGNFVKREENEYAIETYPVQ